MTNTPDDPNEQNPGRGEAKAPGWDAPPPQEAPNQGWDATPEPPQYGQVDPNRQAPAQQNWGAPAQAPPSPYGQGTGEGWANLQAPAPQGPPRRTPFMYIASVSAWIWGIIWLIAGITVGVFLSSAPDHELRKALEPSYAQLREAGITMEEAIELVRGTAWILAIIFIVIALLSILAGIFALVGSNGWRIFGIVGAAIMTGLAVLGSFSGTTESLLGVILPVISLVFWALSGSWYRARKEHKRMLLYSRSY